MEKNEGAKVGVKNTVNQISIPVVTFQGAEYLSYEHLDAHRTYASRTDALIDIFIMIFKSSKQYFVNSLNLRYLNRNKCTVYFGGC